MSSTGAVTMEDEEIKNTYLKAVAELGRGGRVTESGRQFIEEIDRIFDVTGLDTLAFQGVVVTIAKERYGDEVGDDEKDSVTTSLRSFLKTAGSPFDTLKDGRKVMIRKRDED